MRRIIDWLEDRAGIRALWRATADEKVPGGARLTYVFGSVLTYLFIQQVVLGVLLATYYSPSATDAWASVAFLQDQVTFGWFLRGLHHHGSSAMVVVLALHFVQVTLYGAYRNPRELNWWTGLVMALLVLGFALTGYLLPWDQKGYWATQVATGIVGTVPAGEPLKVLAQGGSEYGNLTLTRFYALHVLVLPILLGGLLIAHIYLFRRHGVTPSARISQTDLERRMQYFIPHQLVYDMAAMTVTALVLILLTVETHGAELFAPAQPASNFVARPEWYFLFLFQLLKYFEGPLQIIATVIVPGVAVVFLVALPFIDRAQSRRARERLPVLAGVGVLMVGVVALTAMAIVEDANNDSYQKGLAAAQEEARAARKWALSGVSPRGGEAVFENDPKFKVRMLFKEHCATCHTIDGVGGDEAPVLTDYKSRQWISGLIRNPNDPAYFGNTALDMMEPYPPSELPDDKLRAVVEYVYGLMGEVEYDAQLAGVGQQLFDDELDCSTCHEVEAGRSGDGPNLHRHGSVQWVGEVIRDSSKIYGEKAKMPAFHDKLGAEDIALLAEYVVGLRGAAAAVASGDK